MTRWEERRQERDGMRRLELTWSRTWPDRSHDFTANDGPILVGRVYRALGGPEGGHWKWAMTAMIGNNTGTTSGVAADQDDACLKVERNYRLFRQRIGAN
jgi:hypothetical protein